jgi:hypothetical protein
MFVVAVAAAVVVVVVVVVVAAAAHAATVVAVAFAVVVIALIKSCVLFQSRRVDAIASGSPIWGEASLMVWCDADTSPHIVN